MLMTFECFSAAYIFQNIEIHPGLCDLLLMLVGEFCARKRESVITGFSQDLTEF